jgi:transcriptional adapter 2-alpha
VPCFSEGKFTKTHDPVSHPYRVIEQHSIPIYTDDWGADEELLLLEGAETYGLGSWAETADHIGGCRTKEEVRKHYIETYINSSKFPLPEHSNPEDREFIDEIPREEFQARKKRRIEDRKEAARNAVQAPPKQKPTASVPSCHEVAGYMPGRLEFETEYFNEAEEAVQHMQFDSGDALKPQEPESELELKMTIMDVYNSRLVQRVERKRIIFEHQLLEYKKNQQLDKKRSKEERDLMGRAKPFARMMNHDDFSQFCSDIEYEHNLRQAIGQLQEWRVNHITSLKAGEAYESEKQSRNTQRGLGSGLGSQFSGLDRLTARALGRNAAQAGTEGPTEATRFVAADLALRPFAAGNITSTNFGGLSTPPPSDAEGPVTNGVNGINGHYDGVNGKAQKYVMAPVPHISALNFEREGVEDAHLLTEEEKEICQALRIYPKPYIVLKDAVIKEAVKLGGAMKKKEMRDLCRIDTTKAYRLFDFWVHCGWLIKA